MYRMPASLLVLLPAISWCSGQSIADQSPGEGRTLSQVLTSLQVPVNAGELRNLDKVITSGAQFSDDQQFVIAYYVRDESGSLHPPLFLDTLNRHSGKWRSASFDLAQTKSGDVNIDCFGAVMLIQKLGSFVALGTHLGPSAGCVILLSENLKIQGVLYGWVVANFADGTIVYHRSQVHFAPVHAAEIALYNPSTKKDFTIFPHQPLSGVRRDLMGRLAEFYHKNSDYCEKHNDPCDPESFDSDLVNDPIATDERQEAIAFAMSYALQGYGQVDEKPSGPSRVVYVFRFAKDEAKMEYRELDSQELSSRYAAATLRDLVQPEVLEKIFSKDKH